MVMAFSSDTTLLDWCVHGLTAAEKSSRLAPSCRALRDICSDLGGRHMECAYNFDFCQLCPIGMTKTGSVLNSGVA